MQDGPVPAGRPPPSQNPEYASELPSAGSTDGLLWAGRRISFRHKASGQQLPYVFVVEPSLLSSEVYNFALADKPQSHLRIGDARRVDLDGGRGPYASFKVVHHGGDVLSLLSVAYESKPCANGTTGWCLGWDPASKQPFGNAAANDPVSHFEVVDAGGTAAPRALVDPFSEADKRHFVEKGYVILRNAVPKEIVNNALRRINHEMGKPTFHMEPPEKAVFPPTTQRSSDIQDLFFESKVYDAVVSLFGGAEKCAPRGVPRSAQVPTGADGQVPQRGGWHIDGMEHVHAGENHPFTLLIGVALSDQSSPESGNLRVYPGSHLKLVEPYKAAVANRSPLDVVDVGPSEWVLLAPGDVVIAHQMLAHGIGSNSSPNIRYQIYFRVVHREHLYLKTLMLDDLWVEFDGLRQITKSPVPPAAPPGFLAKAAATFVAQQVASPSDMSSGAHAPVTTPAASPGNFGSGRGMGRGGAAGGFGGFGQKPAAPGAGAQSADFSAVQLPPNLQFLQGTPQAMAFVQQYPAVISFLMQHPEMLERIRANPQMAITMLQNNPKAMARLGRQ